LLLRKDLTVTNIFSLLSATILVGFSSVIVSLPAQRTHASPDQAEGTLVAAELKQSTVPGQSLEGTSWVLAGWEGGSAPRLPVSGTQITAEFSNGQIAGSAGCNPYKGTYRTSDNRLTIEAVGTTRKACDRNVMQQESQYLAALQNTQRYQINAKGQLRIFYGSGLFRRFVVLNPQKSSSDPLLPAVRGIQFDRVQLVPSATEPDVDLEAAIRDVYPDYRNQRSANPARYYYNRVDLNGDRRPDAVVYLTGQDFCGSGGCTILLFQFTGRGYRAIGTIPASRHPIVVTNSQTNGWNDLIRPTSGGGATLNYSWLRFQRGEYQDQGEIPSNSTITGRAMIANPLSETRGIVLKPR
jgi:heat shock protein HslJ